MSNILKQRLQARQSVQTEHPGTDLLAAFVEHELKDSEREKLLAHLAACSACRDAIALAAPEAIPTDLEAPAVRGFTLHFPAAMRWVSVAAALAVAVGVGVLSFERETVSISRKTAATPASSVQQAPSVIAASEQAKALPDQQNAPSRTEKTAQRKKSVTPNPGTVNGLVALEANRARGARADKAETSGAVFAKKLREQPIEVASENQPLVQSTEAYLDSAAVKPTNTVSQNEIAEASPAPAAPAAPPPSPASGTSTAPTDQVGQVAFADSTAAVDTKNPTSSDRRTMVVAGGAGPVREEALTMPPKASGFTAIGGSMVKGSATALTEIVSWTVTAAGKLQRQLRNGAIKYIEPAPGVMVRAVAARGIEVWAGGSQSDLSAKQWRQLPALFHSSDAGETWTRVNGPWQGPINAVTLAGPGNLIVATQDGTWISRDSGKSWITE